MSNKSNRIDKVAVARSFSKAASHYDDFAQLQRDIGDELFKRTAHLTAINHIVDLGCGTGYFSEKLQAKFETSQLTCFDISEAMLERVKQKKLTSTAYVCGDIDDLPQLQCKASLIFSNLVVQWSEDLASVLTSLYAQLEPKGKVIFSTLLDGSLTELACAWKRVDDFPHVNQFHKKTELDKILKNSSFKNAIVKQETRVLEYNNVIDIMHALKGIGANHVNGHHNIRLSGKALISQLELGYQPFKNEQGNLPLTYQVCYVELTK